MTDDATRAEQEEEERRVHNERRVGEGVNEETPPSEEAPVAAPSETAEDADNVDGNES